MPRRLTAPRNDSRCYCGAVDRSNAAAIRAFLCIDWTTGQEVWRQPLPGRCPSPVFADGRMVLRCTDGAVMLAEATPRGYAAKGSFRIPVTPQGAGGIYEGWSAPVVAGASEERGRTADARAVRRPGGRGR